METAYIKFQHDLRVLIDCFYYLKYYLSVQWWFDKGTANMVWNPFFFIQFASTKVIHGLAEIDCVDGNVLRNSITVENVYNWVSQTNRDRGLNASLVGETTGASGTQEGGSPVVTRSVVWISANSVYQTKGEKRTMKKTMSLHPKDPNPRPPDGSCTCNKKRSSMVRSSEK